VYNSEKQRLIVSFNSSFLSTLVRRVVKDALDGTVGRIDDVFVPLLFLFSL